MRVLGANPRRRDRSMSLLTHTLDQMSWDELYDACQTSPELTGLIRAHVYDRLQATPRRIAYLETLPLSEIIDQQIRIESFQNSRPVARCLFPDEQKEEKDQKTP